MAALVGDLLPVDLTSRPTKASFGQVFFNRRSRAFAAGWDGTGLDPSIVNVPELQRIWASESPDARTYTLMQFLAGQKSAESGLQ
jgi:hypothetical protein